MHLVQERLLVLSKKKNLAKMSLRDMARAIGMPAESPQKIKHHLLQLQKKGFLTMDRAKGLMERSLLAPSWAKGLLDKSSRLFSIPIIGTANCGPTTIFAEQNFQGLLRVSSKLVGRRKPEGLYAIKASGASMNRATVKGKKIEDGDYVIVDKEDTDVATNDVVLAIVDDKGVIKRIVDDRKNEQIILKSDSFFEYEPIHLHPDDAFNITGKVVAVVKGS